jgi:hypothetical protein
MAIFDDPKNCVRFCVNFGTHRRSPQIVERAYTHSSTPVLHGHQARRVAIALRKDAPIAGDNIHMSVNTLRILRRWMRMFTISKQSCVTEAFNEFDAYDRTNSSSYNDRQLDVMGELSAPHRSAAPARGSARGPLRERKDAGLSIGAKVGEATKHPSI